MPPPATSIVVTLSMWEDDDGLRGRVLIERTDDAPRTLVVPPAELCRVACDALEDWARRH